MNQLMYKNMLYYRTFLLLFYQFDFMVNLDAERIFKSQKFRSKYLKTTQIECLFKKEAEIPASFFFIQ